MILVLSPVSRSWSLEEPQSDKHPRFLGFLAAQVLAVFKMREDEKWTTHAYGDRLRELLHDTTASYMPLGLNPTQHQALWRQGLERWANVIQRERWGAVRLPLPTQPYDHVGLPKSQALLTLADYPDKPTPFALQNRHSLSVYVILHVVDDML